MKALLYWEKDNDKYSLLGFKIVKENSSSRRTLVVVREHLPALGSLPRVCFITLNNFFF